MSKRKLNKSSAMEIIKLFLTAFIISFVFSIFFKVARVDGPSMDNTLYSGEKILLSTSMYKRRSPSRGDIIVVRSNSLERSHLVKRIIGLPGDILEIKDNVVYINGVILEEPYIKESMNTADLYVDIPENKIFVMGDNRNVSSDSRNMTSVGLFNYKSNVVGKAIYNISDFRRIK